MDHIKKDAVRNGATESHGRVANMTMDVMIPDEIKSELISDANLVRDATNVETPSKFKTGEGATATDEQSYVGETTDVKVEPVFDAYMTNAVEYETRGEESRSIKTEPIVDAEMTTVSEESKNSQYEPDKSGSKWVTSTVKRPVNKMGNVRRVTVEEETDAGMKCETGLTFPVKLKLEPEEGVGTTKNQSRTPPGVIYPVKIESEIDLNVDIIKEESEMSAERTQTVNSHSHKGAPQTAGQWPKSTAAENILVDVVPNAYLSGNGLEQCHAPAPVRIIPVKMAAYRPQNVKKVMDNPENSAVKSFYSAKLVQNAPEVETSASERVAPSVLETSLRKTCKGGHETQTCMRNLCQSLPYVPARMRSTVENQVKSPEKTLLPVQMLPHLSTETDRGYHVQSQTGLKRGAPVKIVQSTAATETIMASDHVESPEGKFTQGHIIPGTVNDAEVDDASTRKRTPLQIVPNASAPQNDFQTQSIVQKLVDVKTAPGTTLCTTNSIININNNEMFKFPVKTESELDLDTSTSYGSVEHTSVAPKKTVKMTGSFVKSKKYGNNVKEAKSDPSEYPSDYISAPTDMFNTKKIVAGELDAEFLYRTLLATTLPPTVGTYSNAKIDENSLKANVKQEIQIFPRFDQTQMDLFSFASEMRTADKLRATPTTDVSGISPVDFGIKPKSFRRPRKEKLEVKKDIDFEIIPINSAGEENLKSQRGTSSNELEIPEMPPEVAAELTEIAEAIRKSNKTAAELVQEHGPRVKELWKACKNAAKKPGVRSKTNRRQEFKAWVMSAGEPGVYIMKTIAKSVADYTRKRREKIKQLAEAGDPEALEVFSRVLKNRRKFIERRRALREAGGPAAMAMAQRARDRERKRRAQKALMKSGNCLHGSV